MAASFQMVDGGPTNNLAWRKVDVTLDSSYPTGGYTISSANLGFSKVRAVFVMSHTGGYVYEWTGSALKAYRDGGVAGALTEVPNTTNLSGTIVHLFVLGDVSA